MWHFFVREATCFLDWSLSGCWIVMGPLASVLSLLYCVSVYLCIYLRCHAVSKLVSAVCERQGFGIVCIFLLGTQTFLSICMTTVCWTIRKHFKNLNGSWDGFVLAPIPIAIAIPIPVRVANPSVCWVRKSLLCGVVCRSHETLLPVPCVAWV